jgi:hypothetical protein
MIIIYKDWWEGHESVGGVREITDDQVYFARLRRVHKGIRQEQTGGEEALPMAVVTIINYSFIPSDYYDISLILSF